MTFTASQRASRPSVSRKRDARTAILRAVYGPSITTADSKNWKGKRDFAKRAPPAKRREVLQANWEVAEWPEITFERICNDAGVSRELILRILIAKEEFCPEWLDCHSPGPWNYELRYWGPEEGGVCFTAGCRSFKNKAEAIAHWKKRIVEHETRLKNGYDFNANAVQGIARARLFIKALRAFRAPKP